MRPDFALVQESLSHDVVVPEVEGLRIGIVVDLELFLLAEKVWGVLRRRWAQMVVAQAATAVGLGYV